VEAAMEVMHPKCAGLDVHGKRVSACARIVSDTSIVREVRSFGTSTRELQSLADWLASKACTHVAMESTGVYWKPVWHVLEGRFDLVLANAMHVRNMPGRKSDVNDATWLAELLAHGLIRASFVPPAPVQELRDLTRTRKQLVREIARHTLRLQKTLEDANVKLTSVVSDVLGASGRAILAAIVNGESDPERLADLTKGRLRASRPQIVEALRGSITEHHRFMIKVHLEQIEQLERAVREVEARAGSGPFRAAIQLLSTIPGVSQTTATVIVAEIGEDMSRFPSAGHLLSWAGLCPRLDESAGKRLSNRIRRGDPWLKTSLVQAAWAASNKRNSYLRSRFLRLKARRGPKKAVVAVAASILVAAYYMLKTGALYEDLGPHHFERLDRRKATDRLVRRLNALGYRVRLEPAA
jgi:transposase